ncbi:MAG: YqgE/AlgH family protein [Acidobacteria bacterium]|nr:YqgE/AlgH family protein [Acidobacteriota bacterium]
MDNAAPPGWRKLKLAFLFLLLALMVVGILPGGTPIAKTPAPTALRGHLLVATSQLRDPPFAGSVIYIVEHSTEGAMGLIVNQPLRKVSVSEFLPQRSIKTPDDAYKLLVYFGGPVELNLGFILHSADVRVKNSRVIAKGVAMTMDPTMLHSIAQGKGPKKYIFILGYAGWRAKQLEAEIMRGLWFTAEADPSAVFAEDPARTWKRMMDKHVFRL